MTYAEVSNALDDLFTKTCKESSNISYTLSFTPSESQNLDKVKTFLSKVLWNGDYQF